MAEREAAALRRELAALRADKDARIDELQAELVELLREMEEKDDALDQLREEGGGGEPRRSRGLGDAEDLEEENLRLAERVERAEADVEAQRAIALRSKEALKEKEMELEEVKVQLAEERLKNESVAAELEHAEKAQQRAREERRRAEQISMRAREDQRGDQQSRTSLLSEQQQLREENTELSATLARERTTQEEMLELLDDLNEDKDQLLTANADLEREMDELRAEMAEVAGDRDELRGKVQEEAQQAEDREGEVRVVEAQLRTQVAVLEADLQKVAARNASLEATLTSFKEHSGLGQLERDLAGARLGAQRAQEDRAEMEARLEQALLDLEAMTEALDAANEATDERVYSMVAQERLEGRKTQRKLEETQARLQEEVERREETEKAKGRLDVDLLEAQAQVIDLASDKGMLDAINDQKQLKKRLRRAQDEYEALNEKYSELRDDRDILIETCRRLKHEAGRDETFWYPEMEVREAIASDLASLTAKNAEQDRQIEHLEGEQHRLLQALRDNAASISDKGIKFLGLGPQQLMRVNEFAANLRDGKVSLPLDDRSRALQKQLLEADQALEMEKRIAGETQLRMEIQVEALQAEVTRDGNAPRPSAQLAAATQMELTSMMRGMRETMQKQLAETQEAVQAALAKAALEAAAAVSEEEESDAEAPAEPAANASPARTRRPSEVVRDMLEGHLHAQQTQLDRLLETNERLMAQMEARQGQQAAPVELTGAELFQGAGPTTRQGRSMLARQLSALALPPEEWAEEVKSLAAQLVQALEQLDAREQEVEAHAGLLRRYEANVMQMKAQMGVAYHEYTEHVVQADTKEKELIERLGQLEEDRDKLAVKAKKFETLCDQLEESPTELQQNLKAQTRRCTLLEVNEAVLARRYRSLESQLLQERDQRKESETALQEATAAWRHRILYLEQWKARAVGEMEVYAARLERSCTKARCEAAELELRHLREEHLELLGREAELRIRVASDAELPRRILMLQKQCDAHEQDAERLQHLLDAKVAEAQTLRVTYEAALDGSDTRDLGRHLRETARHQAEALRLGAEVEALRKEAATTESRRSDAEALLIEREELCQELEGRVLGATQEMQAARRAQEALQHAVGGGLDSAAAEDLRQRVEAAELHQQRLTQEVTRQKELADVASFQAEQAQRLAGRESLELEQLRTALVDLEQQSDDNIIIGKLQRQIFGLKAKLHDLEASHEQLRGQLRKRETMARVLDARLEVREDAFAKYRQAAGRAREELEEAVRRLSDQVGGLREPTSALARAQGFADQVRQLTELSEQREVALRDTEGKQEALQLEVQRLEMEKEELASLAGALRSAAAGAGQGELARQLEEISGAVREAKLRALEAQREASNQREERRLAAQRLLRSDARVAELEEALAEAKTEAILSHVTAARGGDAAALAGAGSGLPGPGFSDDAVPDAGGAAVDAALLQPLANLDGLAAVELLRARRNLEEDLRQQILAAAGGGDGVLVQGEARARLVAQAGEIGEVQARLQKLRGELEQTQLANETLSHRLAEQDLSLQYYEKLAQHHSLPLAPQVCGEAGGARRTPAGAEAANPVQLRRHQELQDVAHTTITSLRRLIEDKNRAIRGYQQKISALQRERRAAHRAGRAEFRKAAEDQYEQDAQRIEELRRLVRKLEDDIGRGGDGGAVAARFLQQLEELQGILGEKDREAQALEEKLRGERHKAERAEARAGELVTEMTKMKSDLLVLAQQLQDAEARVVEALEDRGGRKRLAALQKRLAGREAKMRELRLGMVRLKQEFLREQERLELQAGEGAKEAVGRVERRDEVLREEVRSLEETVGALQEAVRAAKEEAERKGFKAEAAVRSAAEMADENRRLGVEMEAREAQLRRVEVAREEIGEEVELLRQREAKLVTKLKRARVRVDDDADTDAGDSKAGPETGDGYAEADAKGGRPGVRMQMALEDAKRRILLLEAQNDALRAAADAAGAKAKARPDPERYELFPGKATHEGTRRESAGLERDEIRNLKQRQRILTERLEAQQGDLEAAEGALAQARGQVRDLQREKAALQHRYDASSGGRRTASIAATGETEALRKQIFSLESEMESLRREKERGVGGEMLRLRAEGALAREAQGDAEAASRRLRRQLDDLLDVGGEAASDMRKSEARFSELAAAREAAEQLNARLRTAEGQLLEKEAKNLELAFEVSSAASRGERLARRVQELEEITANDGAHGGMSPEAGSKVRRAGGRFKRERDLEGVVDALKRVVDKLKAENERLRRGAAESTRVAEAERRAREARSRAQELTAELTTLRARATAGEEASQRLASKTEQTAQMRRALKRRDAELKDLRSQVDAIERARAAATEVAETANQRVLSLERQVDGARAQRGGSGIRELREELERVREERDAAREAAKAAAASAGRLTPSELTVTRGPSTEVEGLQHALDKERRQRRQLEQRANEAAALAAENRQLRRQTEKMAAELKSFDLDFFEEIENLKFEHQQMAKVLRSHGLSVTG